jgi:2-polyprenyl-6-methoxyphenol hydroxylase-like FAD-dependent oxidoreductase
LKNKIKLGSDGANSFVREKAKFNVMRWNHDQMAIIATLKLAEVFLDQNQNRLDFKESLV